MWRCPDNFCYIHVFVTLVRKIADQFVVLSVVFPIVHSGRVRWPVHRLVAVLVAQTLGQDVEEGALELT